jgi:hypothetical protein
MSVSERESMSSGRLQRSSYNCVLERNLEACWILRVVRTCCWNVQTDASWSSLKLLDTGEGLDGKFSSSGRMMLWRWASERYDTSSGRLALWTDGRPDQTADREPNFLPCKLCRIFWKHFWIAESLLKSIFTKKWFCPTECGQLQTNKLPLWPLWDKNHLTC